MGDFSITRGLEREKSRFVMSMFMVDKRERRKGRYVAFEVLLASRGRVTLAACCRCCCGHENASMFSRGPKGVTMGYSSIIRGLEREKSRFVMSMFMVDDGRERRHCKELDNSVATSYMWSSTGYMVNLLFALK